MTKATTIVSNSHQNKQPKRSRPVRDYGDGDDDDDYYTYYNIVVMHKHLLPTPGSVVTRIDRNDVEEVLESLTTTTIRTNKNCKKCPTPDDVHYCATLGVSFWGNDNDEDDKVLYKKKNLNQVIASGRILLDQDTLRVYHKSNRIMTIIIKQQ